MKKLGIFVMSIAMVSMLFTACKKDNGTSGGGGQDLDNIVENGFYVVGEAAGYPEFNVLCQFAPGRNEADENKLRDGMYEKYIVLEAGKKFQFIKKEGDQQTKYGAELTYGKLPTDNQEVDGYKGSLAENVEMEVKETGLYHIVLDFDVDEALKNVGGPQIVMAKINDWGIGGSTNGWGYAACNEAKDYKYTWTDFEFTEGAEFKFKNLNAWKLNLDDAELVKANTNIGADGVPGGNNIAVKEGGLYKVVLTFALAKGDIGESFKYELTKTGEVAFKDYSEVELELVGDAINVQPGSEDDDIWSWGQKLALGKPAKDGDLFVWEADVELNAAGGFKVRTKDYAPQGDFDAFDFGKDGGGDNATVEADGLYKVQATINGKTGAKNLILTPAN